MQDAIRTVTFLRYTDGGGGLQEKGLFPGLQKYCSPEQLLSLCITCLPVSLPKAGSPLEGCV